MINIDPEQLETMANRIDTWAQELKESVVSRANQEMSEVEGLPGFEGQAATMYRQKFTELTTEIQRAIETISDEQLAGMRENLTKIGRSFEDMDSSFSF
jgi:WXG100 family type VII secretion target